MHYTSYLLVAATAVPAAVIASPTWLRGGNNEEENGQSISRSLYEGFTNLFYETMDSTDRRAPEKRSAFSDRLHLLSNFSFDSIATTSIGDSRASYYYMEWFLTGDDLGCTSDSLPHIKLQCSNGGRIHVDHACLLHGIDTAVCIHGSGETFDYTSDYFGAWCSGNNHTELGLSVELAGVNATCSSASGETAHGISLGQACGAFGEKNFTLIVQPEFCDDPFQYLSGDTIDGNDRCMAIAQASQDNLQVSLPVVKASASLSRAACIYDVNI